MGPRHLLQLLLLLLALLLATQAAGPPRAKGNRTQGAAAPRRTPKPVKDLNHTLAGQGAAAPTTGAGDGRARGPGSGGPRAPAGGGGGGSSPAHETCWGYYDVSGQWDKEFECNNSQSGFRYCCGTCHYRFCCNKRTEKLNQSQCRNYQTPDWAPTTTSRGLPFPEGGPEDPNYKYDPDKDSTNATVYISCGAIAFVLIVGVFAKVAYDKAHRPPREMNIHRALADILRQQGPIPIAHCERETISAIDTSPKENTPVRTSSKNHYTPVRTSKSNPGHYGKDIYRSGGPDLHNFISSGFVTLGRGHTKAWVEIPARRKQRETPLNLPTGWGLNGTRKNSWMVVHEAFPEKGGFTVILYLIKP
ncbi:shisa-6-like protein [Alligator mississippiensis]|uniref:Shisa-6-like protein n=1 Tax=Alligator mississippiensis TaxID=8496 RepID=A0A151P7F9_ALLMI|nr:shisa-6-like protein [Alligator mississippiensis]